MGGLPYVTIRVVMWAIGISAAAFPVYFAGGITAVNPIEAASSLNREKLFRDLFYLIIIASVLAVSNLIQFFMRRHRDAPTYQFFLAILALIFFFIVTVIGFVGFTDVPIGGSVSAAFLPRWTWTILITLAVSLAVEICVSILEPPTPGWRSRYGQPLDWSDY